MTIFLLQIFKKLIDENIILIEKNIRFTKRYNFSLFN